MTLASSKPRRIDAQGALDQTVGLAVRGGVHARDAPAGEEIIDLTHANARNVHAGESIEQRRPRRRKTEVLAARRADPRARVSGERSSDDP